MAEYPVISLPIAERELEGGAFARYERPSDQIRRFVTGYHLYRAPRGQLRNDWFLPGTANIRISWCAKPIAVTIGERHFAPLPQAALFGPTSQAMHAKTRGGFMVGIGISALGWSRLFSRSADTVADTIVPLDTLWPASDAAELTSMLQRHDVATPVAPLLDRFFEPRLAERQRHEPMIARLAALLIDENIDEVQQIVAAMGMEANGIRRLAYRYFGFSPKHLLRRARFLRAIIAATRDGAAVPSATLTGNFFDQSHFIREAHSFLGMTPGQFADASKPFLSASLDLRPAVLGAVTQALQPLEE